VTQTWADRAAGIKGVQGGSGWGRIVEPARGRSDLAVGETENKG